MAVQVVKRNPKWTWEEEILAFDLYLRHGLIDDRHPEVQALSSFLCAMRIHGEYERTATFRNANGVARKLSDIHSHRPGYKGQPTAGSHLDREVWTRIGEDREHVSLLAQAIRESAEIDSPVIDDEVEFEACHLEGRMVYRRHRLRERHPAVRQRKIAAMMRAEGELSCEACDVRLGQTLGDLGRGIYECHHIVPLAVSGETITTINEVALLCPTCHRISHRVNPWPSKEELRAVVRHVRS